MKTIELFYLPDCPYCIKAKNALKELIEENPAYGNVEIKWIDESVESEYADSRDYYYVPTIFFGEDKLYEANPSEESKEIKAAVRAALDKVLSTHVPVDYDLSPLAPMPQFTLAHVEMLLDIFDGLMELENGIGELLGWTVQPEGNGGKLYRVIDLLREISVVQGDDFHALLFAEDIGNAEKARKLMGLA